MTMLTRSVAETYHELTKYSPESIQRPNKIDWNHPPDQVKYYATGDVVDLSHYLTLLERPRTPSATLLAAQMGADEVSLAQLSHLLYLTNGVTAVLPHPQRDFMMRAAPSAGGLYPTELYVVSRGYPGLPDGAYNFQVRDHSLLAFWPGDHMARLQQACFGHPALAEADLAIVASSVFFRSAWRYQDRAYRRICLDTGHVLGNLEMAAPWFDRIALPIGGFFDDELNELFFFERGSEEALAVIALPRRDRITSAMLAAPTALASEVELGASSLPEGYRLSALHEASKLHALPGGLPEAPQPMDEESKERYPFAVAEPLQGLPIDWEQGISDAMIQRRSTRAFSGAALSRLELATLLDFTYRPDCSDDPRINADPRYFDATMLGTYVAVNDVAGLEPGCYHYHPGRRELRQIRFKNLSEEVQYLCLGQELGGKASAVVFHTANLPAAIERYGERAYRYLHLDAGHLGQRLNVASMQMGIGVSGIGGFFDDEVNELLGIPESEAVVYITTLGRPAEH
ncbi:SagB/ThcOx family dehydrogenase [bacterium]|nr:SagB/ThcOx family dehydrogenase [bacterium]